MSLRSFIRSVRYILAVTAQAARRPVAAGHTYLVNSTTDSADGDVTLGICLYLNGKCTRRAGIMQANYSSGLRAIT